MRDITSIPMDSVLVATLTVVVWLAIRVQYVLTAREDIILSLMPVSHVKAGILTVYYVMKINVSSVKEGTTYRRVPV